MQNQPFSAYLDPNAQIPSPANVTSQVGQSASTGMSTKTKQDSNLGTKDALKLGLVLAALLAGKGGGGMGAGPNAGLAALGGVSEGLQQRGETQKRDVLLKQKQATDATNAYYEHAPNMDDTDREEAVQHVNTIRQQAGMEPIGVWQQSAAAQSTIDYNAARMGQIGKVEPPTPMSDKDKLATALDIWKTSGGTAGTDAINTLGQQTGMTTAPWPAGKPFPEGSGGVRSTLGENLIPGGAAPTPPAGVQQVNANIVARMIAQAQTAWLRESGSWQSPEKKRAFAISQAALINEQVQGANVQPEQIE